MTDDDNEATGKDEDGSSPPSAMSKRCKTWASYSCSFARRCLKLAEVKPMTDPRMLRLDGSTVDESAFGSASSDSASDGSPTSSAD